MNLFVLLPFMVFSIILGILAYVLIKKFSIYPDFRIGYHDKRVMESKEKWEYANKTAGKLCALWSAVVFSVSILLYHIKLGNKISLIILFTLCIVAVCSILILPIQLSKRK